MNIAGAEAMIELLYNNNLIKNVTDLYYLEKSQLINLERFGEKSADNFLQSLEQSKTIPFERVLYSLGIRFIGETVAKKIVANISNIDELMQLPIEKLTEFEEVGKTIAQSLIDFFKVEENQNLIKRLQFAGLQFTSLENKTELLSTKFENKTFVVSGVFENYSRDEIKNLIELHGGKNVGSISAKTTFLLAGENMGPEKKKKAEKLNVRILSESEFVEMIKN